MVLYIYEKITERGPPIAQPSVCLQKSEVNMKVFSIANFKRKRMNINFERILGNLFLSSILSNL